MCQYGAHEGWYILILSLIRSEFLPCLAASTVESGQGIESQSLTRPYVPSSFEQGLGKNSATGLPIKHDVRW